MSAAILHFGKTITETAEATGIPYSTLNRKLKGHSDFTFVELYMLAKTLQMKVSDIVPRAYFDELAA